MTDPTWHADVDALVAILERPQKTQAIAGVGTDVTISADCAFGIAKVLRAMAEHAKQLEIGFRSANAALKAVQARDVEATLKVLSLRETIRFWVLLRLRAWFKRHRHG